MLPDVRLSKFDEEVTTKLVKKPNGQIDPFSRGHLYPSPSRRPFRCSPPQNVYLAQAPQKSVLLFLRGVLVGLLSNPL